MSRHEQMTVRAADLAEGLVDEISRSEQDWGAIEQRARTLVELLAGLKRPTARRRARVIAPPARPR
jgi:hypothetical protein